MSYHAYRTAPDQVVLTVSQLYPVRELAEFVTAPVSKDKGNVATASYPEVPWTATDVAALAEGANNAIALAIMDLCALTPGTWVPSSEAFQRAGVGASSARGQLGGFGLTVRARFKRANPPYDSQWAAGGTNQSYYRLSPGLAQVWREIRGDEIDVPLIAVAGDANPPPLALDDGAPPSG